MSSVFTSNVVTQAGLRLIAEATAANPIVYVDALSASQIPQDPEAIPFYNGGDGIIDASSATDNTARIVSRFGNSSSSTAQPVKAIAITARLSSQQDSDKVIFAYCSDANSQIVFPPSSAPEQRTRFAFNLTFDGQGTFEVVEAGSASLSDLERLVSCHKAGNPDAGDDQQIRGSKTFLDEAVFGDTVIHENTVYLDADILPGQANTYRIGNSVGSRLSDVYTKTLHVGTLIGGDTISSNWTVELGNDMVPESSTITSGVSTVGLGSGNARFSSVYAARVDGSRLSIWESNYQASGTLTYDASDGFVFDAAIECGGLFPNSDQQRNLGAPGKQWLYAYIKTLLTGDAFLSGRVSSRSAYTPLDDTNSVSSNTLLALQSEYGNYYAVTVGAPTTKHYIDNKDIGRLSVSYIPDPVPNVYEGNLTKVPIGALVLAFPTSYWAKNDGSGRDINPGSSITVSKEVNNQWIAAEWDASSGYSVKALSTPNNYSYLEPGTYRALSYIKTSGTTQTICNTPVLLQRVS